MIPAEAVRAWIAEGYGIEFDGLTTVAGGIDRNAGRWRAECRGRAWAVKVSRSTSEAAVALTAYLADQGVPGVPGPVRAHNGAPYLVRDGLICWLVPWVTGRRPIRTGMGRHHWEQLGRMLRSIHDAAVPAQLGSLPVETFDPTIAIGRARAVGQAIASGNLPDGTPTATDELATELIALWQAHSSAIGAVAATAAELASGLSSARSCADFVLCHGDPHLGNLVVSADDELWLLDWDDACLAPREQDLMFVTGGGVLAFAPVEDTQQEAIFRGYGSVGTDITRLTYARCTRALIDVADPALAVLDGSLPAGERASSLEIAQGVVSATGLLQQALDRSTSSC